MISENKWRLIKAFIFSLTVAFLLPLNVFAQTDASLSPVSDEQTEYEISVVSDDLVGQLDAGIDARAESGARAAIHEGLKQHAESIDISAYGLTYNSAQALIGDVVYWDGSLFYAEPYAGRIREVNGYVTHVYPVYIEHEKEIGNALKRVVRECITPDMSNLQKMVALHNWLATNCKYDHTYEKYTVYDALVLGSSVCQGYKDAYEMLLRYVGIVEVGTATGGNHIWNQVKVDGQWYNIDVTWDSNAIENGLFGQMYYGNFMISDSQLKKNHTVESQDYECTSTLYDKGGWWNAGGRYVQSAAVPVNGAGSYRLGYERPNMSLIYRTEATGAEKVVHVFHNADWGYRNGNYFSYNPNCYGVLISVGRNIFVNDAKSVYLVTDNGNVSAIYTYDNADGRKIFGMRERFGNLEIQIGIEPSVSRLETKTISLESYIEDPEVKEIKDFVKRMYITTLGREASAEELKYYVDQLQSGAIDGATIAQNFVGSSEFQGKNLSAEEYVAAMYEAFFGRSAGAAEIQYWKSEMDSGVSRRYVLSGFVNSNEFEILCQKAGITRGLMVLAEGEEYEINYDKLGEFVERLYVCALKRNNRPSEAEKQYYVTAIANRTMSAEMAAKNFFFSPEFEGQQNSDEEYIGRLYRTFMGREPAVSETGYWISQMRAGLTRVTVLERFAASDEFKKIMASYGIR